LGRLTSQMRLKAVAPMKPRMRAPQQPLLQLLDARLGEHFPRARYLLELLFVREIARMGRHFTFGIVIVELGDFAHSPGLTERNRDEGTSFQGTKHSGWIRKNSRCDYAHSKGRRRFPHKGGAGMMSWRAARRMCERGGGDAVYPDYLISVPLVQRHPCDVLRSVKSTGIVLRLTTHHGSHVSYPMVTLMLPDASGVGFPVSLFVSVKLSEKLQ
jgi:hypothetical protein